MLRKMNFVVALLATLLVIATDASAQKQTNGCNCANASLSGDTVGTKFGGGPVANRTVAAGIELPNAGPVLGAAGPSPRWNIDFGGNTIRIDFLQQVATYGGGASFVFSSLDPQLAGCPPAFVSGIAVSTNKPMTSFNVAAAATFGSHTVTVQIAPNGGNVDWKPGEFILVRLNFACEKPSEPPSTQVDPCCPPWNKELMKNMLFYQGSGSISAPYTLKYVPTPTPSFNNQMQAYINYLHLMNNGITGIAIAWELYDAGSGSSSVPGALLTSSLVTWTWNTSGVGNPSINPGNFFTVSSPHMQVGQWYRIRTRVYLVNGQTFFPEKCALHDIDVRVQVMNAKGAKAGSQPVLEFIDEGKILKSVPISEGREAEPRLEMSPGRPNLNERPNN